MEPAKKEDIKNDLLKFIEGKDYYAKIGKAWKRGYLLYGPPGTGKSTMIAAMANLLNYDVYDLELTAVKDNTELKRLLIDTSNKSIIVIEDIDCSLDLTGQREKKKRREEHEKKKEEGEEDLASVPKIAKEEGTKSSSNVTLSGLLNFIDGLWSACGEERIIVFTTNHVNKLDPALIRRGRMDKHIEMSYCGFEAFKLLAKNYLDVDSHMLFEEVSGLLGETRISPADVAENLMPKSEKDDADVCLKNLIDALKGLKEEAIKKAKEEARLKAEKEERRLKAEKEDGKEEEAKLKAEKEAKEKEEAWLKAEKEEKEKEEARLKAEKEEKEKEEARLKAEEEEKEKEEARLKVEKEKEEARLKVEKEGKENEDALLKALSVELKAKNNLLKRLLKKMKDNRKK